MSWLRVMALARESAALQGQGSFQHARSLRRPHRSQCATLHLSALVAVAVAAYGSAGLGSCVTTAFATRPAYMDDPSIPFGYRPPEPGPPEWRQQLDDCLQDGLILDALELINDEDNVELREDRRSWTDVLSLCAKQRRWKDACKLLETMRNASDAPAPGHEEYHEVLDACERKPLVLDIFNRMASDGLSPNIITVIKTLTALAQQGMVDEATRIYKEAKKNSIIQPWTENGQFLNVQDYPSSVAEIIVRDAVVERAWQSQRKAGKGGFAVLTGFAKSKKSSKLKSVMRVLRDEFGLKARMEPARYGKIMVRHEQFQRLGEELALEGKLPGS